jgi:hypothetical protein
MVINLLGFRETGPQPKIVTVRLSKDWAMRLRELRDEIKAFRDELTFATYEISHKRVRSVHNFICADE